MSAIKLLAIGNSFSEDATYYLHDICQAAGLESKIVNLYIPGCPLEKHWGNIVEDKAAYRYELNGFYELEENKNKLVSIQSVLDEEKWDHILTHQASHDSGILTTYEPFAQNIYRYLKDEQPQAKLWLNQTWAYEIDSDHEAFSRYHKDQAFMYQELTKCYEQTASEVNVPLIQTGDLIQKLRQTPLFDYANGGESLNRDGYHLSFIYGRYAASLLWAQTIFGIQAKTVDYLPKSRFEPNASVDEEKIALIKEIVSQMN